jgi:transposase
VEGGEQPRQQGDAPPGRRLVAARDWLTVFQLPAYATELNPVESVWALLKRSLANLVKRNLTELTALVKTRLRLSHVSRSRDTNKNCRVIIR